eukprot:10271175-Alexandrium_andersonii.AAC.1
MPILIYSAWRCLGPTLKWTRASATFILCSQFRCLIALGCLSNRGPSLRQSRARKHMDTSAGMWPHVRRRRPARLLA